jgi:hypothetical protein
MSNGKEGEYFWYNFSQEADRDLRFSPFKTSDDAPSACMFQIFWQLFIGFSVKFSNKSKLFKGQKNISCFCETSNKDTVKCL